LATIAGAAACVGLTIALAAGTLTNSRSTALAVALFVLLTIWCLTHCRVEHTLAALALYLGLLDGYAKLRTGSIAVTLARDVLVMAIAVGALLRAVQIRARLALPPLAGFVLAFTAVVVIEMANPNSRGLAADAGGLRQHLEFVPLFFLGYAFVRSESQIRTTLLLLVFCAAVGGIVSYIQSTLTPEQFAQWGPGYSERILGTGAFSGAGRVGFAGGLTSVRPFGLGSDAGAGAAAAALVLPGLIALAMTGGRRAWWALAPMSVGVGVAVATSGSRAAIVAVVVALLAFGFIAAASKNGLKAMVGVAFGAGILYAAFTALGPNNTTAQRAQSILPSNAVSTFSSERGQSLDAFGSIAKSHPFGVGIGTVGPAAAAGARQAATYNSETQWNYLLVETGIAGVLVYVAFLLRLVALAVTRIRRVPQAPLRLLLAALAAPLCAVLVVGFSGPTSAAPPISPFVWFTAGVLSYHLVTVFRRAEPAWTAT
jgi:hypothetical protein